MASGLSFFSSPPQPSNPWQHTPLNFFTPQQPSKYIRPNPFAPTSPSPLRTSRNANLMTSPLPSGDIFSKHDHPHRQDENETQSSLMPETPFIGQGQSVVSMGSSSTTPFSTSTSTGTSSFTSTSTPLFSFTHDQATNPQAQTLDRTPQFQYSSRARSSSPSVQLNTHTATNRDARKRLFLDRLKNKRDDARSDRAGDQVLRLEFMREKKRTEAEREWAMSDWAGLVERDLELDTEMDGSANVGLGDGELSPTEEKEVEELAEFYYAQQQGDQAMEEEFEDDGYDEAFMEVLSQESGGQAAFQDPGVFTSSVAQARSDHGFVDSDMDM